MDVLGSSPSGGTMIAILSIIACSLGAAVLIMLNAKAFKDGWDNNRDG